MILSVCAIHGWAQTAVSSSLSDTTEKNNHINSGAMADDQIFSTGGNPPAGAPPGGSPSGNSGTSDYTLHGAFTLNGTTAEQTNQVFLSDTTDISAIFVTNGGFLTLHNPEISTTGNTTSNDASSFYGLNGGVIANNGSTVVIDGGTITTTGSGANGAIPTGEGTKISLSNVTITATGDGGHGVMATSGASLILDNVDITTTGAHGAPIATDRGSGTVSVTGGKVYSSGSDSPGIYSTGIISVTDGIITSAGPEAAVIEGSNSINIKNTSLTGGDTNTPGVMIYKSFSGDAEIGEGIFTMEGGNLNNGEGPVFLVTNTDAVINLTGVDLTSKGNVLVNALATSRWGTEGKNGGQVTLTAEDENLNGSLISDDISSITAILKENSTLTGVIHTADLSLDETSTWNVTGDSFLNSLTDPNGISDTYITNIIGNGYTVTYDPDNKANKALAGKNYSLENGGSLIPYKTG